MKQYAEQLSVHENHLNHAVKEVTGKSPSQHIALRIMEEAKALLKNTDCSIAEIAYSLRFEYPSHFTSFLRRTQIYRLNNIETKIFDIYNYLFD